MLAAAAAQAAVRLVEVNGPGLTARASRAPCGRRRPRAAQLFDVVVRSPFQGSIEGSKAMNGRSRSLVLVGVVLALVVATRSGSKKKSSRPPSRRPRRLQRRRRPPSR